MEFFYFDDKLRAYEKHFQWDQALMYLECLYSKSKGITFLNSLVGYSWYYLIEGPIISQQYANDKNMIALEIWKKYIDIGVQAEKNNAYFNFIAGYTLSLHGFLINEEYEKKGIIFMKRCFDLADSSILQQLAENFLKNEKSPQYIPLNNGKAICAQLFKRDSLLGGYFNEIYG